MNKIDFHVHVTPPDISKNWQKYALKEPYFELLSKSPNNKFSSAEEVISALDDAHFNKAVIFGFAFKDPGLCNYVNDYVIEKIKKFPDRLIGFISVSPNSNECTAEIERCHDAGLKGIGELFPEGQNFNIDDKPKLQSLTEICKERNLPVILHINEPIGHLYAGKTKTDLRQIEQFIENNQGLKIILAHFGGGLFIYESMPEVKEKCRNVYYDTAAAPFLYDSNIYNAAIALGLSKKILFGSDFPLMQINKYMSDMEDIPEQVRDDILGGNAEKLL